MALNPPTSGWLPRIGQLLAELELDVSSDVREGFSTYLDQLTAWNARMDLTAARSLDEFVDLALADAVVIAKDELSRPMNAGVWHWVDVGSGGGAPGIPLFLSLLEGARSFRGTLVEPRSKRVAFLRSCVGELRLSAVDVVRSRSEVLPDKGFDWAVARATLPPPAWLAEGARLAKSAVWVLVAREEAPSHPGWSIDRDLTYCWPLTGSRRRALRYVPTSDLPPAV